MKQKNEKGITLVVLIITIVVALILLGVTINIVFNEGLLGSAKNLANEAENTYNQFQGILANIILEEETAANEENSIQNHIYARLYTDGTLILSHTNYIDSNRTLDEDYGDIIEYTGMPRWIEQTPAQYGFTYTNKANSVIIYDRISPKTTSSWFYNMTDMTTIDLSNLNTKNVISMNSMFSHCSSLTSLDLSNFNTKNVRNMGNMFYGCNSLTSLNLGNFNTSNVTSMTSMFHSCSSLTSLDLTSFNTSNVTDMGAMFYECTGLTSINVSSFDTRNVETIACMFTGCSSLNSIDVSNFNTSNVTNMASLFGGCTSLQDIDLSEFNTNKTTVISGMFANCTSLENIDLSNFYVSITNAENIINIFLNCTSLISVDISGIDINNLQGTWNICGIFQGCSSLKAVYIDKNKWDNDINNKFYASIGESGKPKTNIAIDKNTNNVVGFNITKGWGWSGSTTISRTVNGGRASSTMVLHIDPSKTYSISMTDNTNYYFGIQGLDSSNVKQYDSGWLSPTTVKEISGEEYIVLNFKYQSAGSTTITDDMITEIKQKLVIHIEE